MSSSLVSVLMPAFNHERFVRDAVESVLGQTYANLELIVIDDASQDDTWAAVQSFKEGRLRLYRHEANQGAHATLNRALGLARGDFIAIINSDDRFDPKRIERLLSIVEGADSELPFAFTDVEFIDEEGDAIPTHPRTQAYRRLRAMCGAIPSEFWFLAGNPAVSTSNFFFSRRLMEKVGGFSSLRYTHDWDWALRANRSGSLIWARESLLRYRVHQGSTLSEDDVWRHVHENSYVQADALLRLGELLQADSSGASSAAHGACSALFGNESLHPLSLLCFLLYRLSGIDAKQMLELASCADGNWLLPEIAASVPCPSELFLSIGHLAQREKVITAQKAMIDERWQAMQTMQAALQERWDAMQNMRGEIDKRDHEIREIHADPLIRSILRIRRGWSRLNSRRRQGS